MNLFKSFFTFFLLFWVLQINITYAQSIDWLTNSGGVKSDKASTIVIDDEGNSYITGYYNEQASFGPYDTGFSFLK